LFSAGISAINKDWIRVLNFIENDESAARMLIPLPKVLFVICWPKKLRVEVNISAAKSDRFIAVSFDFACKTTAFSSTKKT